MFQLKVKTRTAAEKVSALRDQGEMPAVYYNQGKAPALVSVLKNEFLKVWRGAGESSTVKLVPEKGTPVDVLIHEVQMDPVRNEPLHVDFLVVDANKPVEISVPVEFVGVAPAVKNGIGSLVKVMHEIEIEALPKDLPHNLEVDISSLVDADSQLTVADIKVPSTVTVLSKPDEIVASIALQKEEVEVVSAPDLSSIEVEKKGKKEEEGAGEEA